MKTRLLVVGKTSNKQLSALIADYVSRINHYMSFQLIELKEDKNGKADIEKEAEIIQKELQPNDYVVVLDEKGAEFTSQNFAKWLNKKHQSGRNLVIIIGGPFGFSRKIYDRCDEKVALSTMTFPHDLARLIITEQLYRACTILKGESYHHD